MTTPINLRQVAAMLNVTSGDRDWLYTQAALGNWPAATDEATDCTVSALEIMDQDAAASVLRAATQRPPCAVCGRRQYMEHEHRR